MHLSYILNGLEVPRLNREFSILMTYLSHRLRPRAKVSLITIPERVTYKAQIKAARSSIEGTGHGLVVEKPVPAGDLIFSIKERLLNIVDDGDGALARTCNNCFMALTPAGSALYNKDVKFPMWSGYKTLYYCSKVSLLPWFLEEGTRLI
jgi:hypothetical protein